MKSNISVKELKSAFFGLALVLVLSAIPAKAVTLIRVLPLGLQAVISIKPGDQDAQTLFELMDVPLKDSPLGPGKGFFVGEKSANFSCSQNRNECQIVVKKNSHTVINATERKISVTLHGSDALQAYQYFLDLDGDNLVGYKTNDGLLWIKAQPESFQLNAHW